MIYSYLFLSPILSYYITTIRGNTMKEKGLVSSEAADRNHYFLTTFYISQFKMHDCRLITREMNFL